jgi:hypothetical protein
LCHEKEKEIEEEEEKEEKFALAEFQITPD